MKKTLMKIVAAMLVLLPSCVFAGYTVSPIELKLNNVDAISSLTIKNENNRSTNFQLIVLKKVMEDGKEVMKETKDFVATPVVFNLKAGKSQLVRVMVKNTMYDTNPKAYRVSIKELPHKSGMKDNGVQVVSEFRVPIIIGESLSK